MTHPEFDEFIHVVLNNATAILGTKSADYSTADDKLANFKLQAQMDGITPIEALRGNHLKHRCSIRQGLDDLQRGVVRPWKWWKEKMTDDLNYNLLLQALIYETHFAKKTCDKLEEGVVNV